MSLTPIPKKKNKMTCTIPRTSVKACNFRKGIGYTEMIWVINSPNLKGYNILEVREHPNLGAHLGVQNKAAQWQKDLDW